MKKYNIIYEANEQLFIILEKIVSQKKVDVKLDVYNSIFEKDENKKMLIENFYDHMFKQNNIIVQAGHFEKVNVFEYIENGITKGRYGESMGPGIGETIKESALKGMSSKTEERSKLNDVWKTLKSKIVGIRSKPTLLSPILETNEANTNNGEKSSSAVVKPVENAVVKPDESAMVKPVETAMAQVSLKPKGPVVLSKRSAMRIPKSTQRRPERRPERTPGSRASAAAGGGLRIRRTRKKRTIKA
jgi:hypothetical protein